MFGGSLQKSLNWYLEKIYNKKNINGIRKEILSLL